MLVKVLNWLRHSYYELMKLLVFVLAAALVVYLMPRAIKFKYDYQAGKPWMYEKLIAPFDFPVYKPENRLKAEKEALVAQVNPYFKYDESVTLLGRDRLISLFNTSWERQQFGEELNREKALGLIAAIYDTIQQAGVLKYHPILENKPDDVPIIIVKNRFAERASLDDVYTIRSAYEEAIRIIRQAASVDSVLLIELAGQVFVQNLMYDEQLTNQEVDAKLADLSPTFGLVQQGELIINEGELVDSEKYNIIRSLQREYENRTGSLSEQRSILAGQALLTGILFLILFLFIKYVRPDVFDELKKINLILLLMLLVIVPALLLLARQPEWVWYVPFGILPIIMITFFDTRLTLMVHILTIIIIALGISNAFEYVFLQLIVGYVVIFSLMCHNKRIFFFRTSVYLILTYAFIYTGFSLLNHAGLQQVDPGMYVAFAVSSLLTLLALPLIFSLERSFGMITDLSLLELSNTNSPLLRELAMIAPGSFQHSIQVANLSEEALYEIGGDTLLARTGALYHDIGKMDNPMYFIENQMGGYNPHDDLSYIESARIIIDHVTSGIERARKAGLPEQIIDFIRTHHGNRRVEYFYIMEQKQKPGLELDERDFSYHGPIPFSKETAVVMMADSVEAASRSLKKPTEQKISDLVENIINKLIETRQFVNANITLKEIDVAKKILKKKLMNIYHVRIAYPD